MHTPSHGRPPSRGQAKAGIPETVHTYNALIAASHRAGFFDRAIQLFAEMRAAGISPNNVTRELVRCRPCNHGVQQLCTS